MANGRGWGQEATVWPGWDRLAEAACQAARSPATWLPVAGALVLQIDNWDHRVSRYASKQTPLFGSQQKARDASDYFLAASEAAYALTVLTTPSGERPGEWLAAKMKGLAVGMSAYGITTGATSGIQQASHRQRPNQADFLSLPSSHSSSASVYSTLAAGNLRYIRIPEPAQRVGQLACILIPAGTAWARVEGNVHYPTDVLLGAALGHFVGNFMNTAFMNIREGNLSLSLEPSQKHLLVGLRLAF